MLNKCSKELDKKDVTNTNVGSIEKDIKTINKTIYQENGEHYNYIDIDNHTPEEECEKFIVSIENLLQDYARQKQINEEHQKINGELREKVKELEETISDYQRMYCRSINEGISKQKIKELKESIILRPVIVGGRSNAKTLEYGIKLGKIKTCEELLKEENK